MSDSDDVWRRILLPDDSVVFHSGILFKQIGNEPIDKPIDWYLLLFSDIINQWRWQPTKYDTIIDNLQLQWYSLFIPQTKSWLLTNDDILSENILTDW